MNGEPLRLGGFLFAYMVNLLRVNIAIRMTEYAISSRAHGVPDTCPLPDIFFSIPVLTLKKPYPLGPAYKHDDRHYG